ncbi:hypothetical protein Fmac_021626 [Flemingia macrophylla]|uniref:diacylglycerol O-acyltransferase n=1 Tax=Flemingia macrophylla TaxID=520843 RepID=A0ABD1LXF0_9FABA
MKKLKSRDAFLPINPRFSSIMVKDENGKMRWNRVEVQPEEHLKVPKFPECISPELYDQYFGDYVASILCERTPPNKPLWEIHIIKYPTSNAAGTVIFKLHHALGDGYSLMSALLSCLQRTDDPSLPLTFPSRKSSSQNAKKSMFRKFPSFISYLFNSITDFGSSLIKTRVIVDDKSPIRSRYEGTESMPLTLSHIPLPLDHIKEIKSKLGVTTLATPPPTPPSPTLTLSTSPNPESPSRASTIATLAHPRPLHPPSPSPRRPIQKTLAAPPPLPPSPTITTFALSASPVNLHLAVSGLP